MQPRATPEPALVELRDVSVSFGATRALDHVSFAVRAGEVHVLAGENGAGKSTLIRVLSGVVTEIEGALCIGGREVRLRGARDAAAHGIATIHQELSLVGSMTVAENLALARPGAFFGWLRGDDEARTARAISREIGLDVDPQALVESLPLAAQQLLEIARALAQKARVLIFDEPTSALAEPEAERLIARIEQLARGGCGVIYISHRMEENERLAHHITVLRDGRVVASRPARELPRAELVACMMGGARDEPALPADVIVSAQHDPSAAAMPSIAERSITVEEIVSAQHDPSLTAPAPLLDVRDLHAALPGGAPLHGVSFALARGEILGLAGLRGAGASEILAALFGANGPPARGHVRLGGAPFVIASPLRSIAQGLVLLANDRSKSLLPDLDIAENITLSSLATVAGLAPWGVPARAREAALAREASARLHVAAPSIHTAAGALSGGNQQKVALLRCLATEPRVLLLDEPTRGVDVGAKADIHRLLRALAARGMTILVVASELSELTALCDRIVILARGHVTTTFTRAAFSHHQLRLALDAAPA